MEHYLINPHQKLSKINRDVYGSFSEHLGRCIYEGTFVGKDSPIPNVNGMRTDVVNALKEIGLPVLRWPGGCFADEYHWRDGIGPLEQRKKMINTHWGGVVEDNSFGTHEFFELCRQLGCEAYITGNVGSGTVREMSEWIEYMTFDGLSPMSEERRRNGQEKPWKLKYFGIGNETWGCGGNMLPEYYADEFRRYNTYCRDYAGVDHIFRVASGANADDYNWTDVLLKKAARFMDGVSLHYYTVPTGDWGHKGSALDFDREMYVDTIRAAYKMEELVTRHSAVMDRYDPKKRIALVVDEWGTWFDVEEGTNPGFLYQQNSLRDAIVAGLTLNIFNKHADRVRMATVAQTINVLQALALTDGEKMLKTPTYFVFKLYKDHMDNTLLGSYLTTPALRDGEKTPTLTESASLCPDGTVIATVVNASPDAAQEISCQIADTAVTAIEAEILTGEMHAHNTFDNNTAVATEAFTAFTATADGFTATLPPCSVVRFRIK